MFLVPDAIQEEIILAGLQQEIAAHYRKGKAEYHLLLTELLQTSLVHRNGARRELWIHRLVQDFALAKLRTVEEEFQRHFDLTVLLLTKVWPFVVGGGVGRASESWEMGLVREAIPPHQPHTAACAWPLLAPNQLSQPVHRLQN